MSICLYVFVVSYIGIRIVQFNSLSCVPRYADFFMLTNSNSERWQIDKSSVDMALLADGAMQRLGSRREARARSKRRRRWKTCEAKKLSCKDCFICIYVVFSYDMNVFDMHLICVFLFILAQIFLLFSVFTSWIKTAPSP